MKYCIHALLIWVNYGNINTSTHHPHTHPPNQPTTNPPTHPHTHTHTHTHIYIYIYIISIDVVCTHNSSKHTCIIAYCFKIILQASEL